MWIMHDSVIMVKSWSSEMVLNKQKLERYYSVVVTNINYRARLDETAV